jgi:hypothetical protein
MKTCFSLAKDTSIESLTYLARDTQLEANLDKSGTSLHVEIQKARASGDQLAATALVRLSTCLPYQNGQPSNTPQSVRFRYSVARNNPV